MLAAMSSSRKSRGKIEVTIWTMRTEGLTEEAVAPWGVVLDAAERARAARFVFAQSRVTFVAAHALTRAALATATGADPAEFAFAAGEHGKPEALLAGRPARLAFNLSHTEGLVGVAICTEADLPLGFDVEPLHRRAPLDVARRYFTGSEVAWLDGLPEARRAEGFFRLWTLKEAFIKATGKGLTHDLSSFWFSVDPPAIGLDPALGERPQDWAFVQRLVGGGFLAALGLRTDGARLAARWLEVRTDSFDARRATPL